MKRLTVLFSLVALFSLALATPALAAAPTNDDASSPTVIGSLPFSDGPYDTTEATGDPDDPDCFGSGSNASVWYAFTTGADPVTLMADTAGSDYASTITVTTGSPSGEIVGCGIEGAQFPAEPSTTYFFVVGSCLNFGDAGIEAIGCDPAASGGSLVFSLNEAPPPPEVALTVNSTGTFDKRTGSATVSGTVSCTGGAYYTEIGVQLTQTVGRFSIIGGGYVSDAFVCDGTVQPWSVEVFGYTGQFKGGRADSATFAYACGDFDCGYDEVLQSIRLR